MGNNLLSAPTGNNDWNTPEKYLQMARDVMGDIDCDPASSDFAQKTVNAKQYFTLETNGFAHDWNGSVWLNPPYSFPAIEGFASKLIREIDKGNVTEAIALTNSSTDTKWFHMLLNYCTYVCFKSGRIAFLDSTGKTRGKGAHGSVFFYFGCRGLNFKRVFGKEGIILYRGVSRTAWDFKYEIGWDIDETDIESFTTTTAS